MGEWFDTGLLMADAKTKRTVYASSEATKEEFLKKGWKMVKKKTVVKRRKSVKRVSTGKAKRE